MAAPVPSLPEPPPLPAKPTPPSKWWMLLLIIPAIATGLAVVASQFQPVKNVRRRWTNWQARLAGHLDPVASPRPKPLQEAPPPPHSPPRKLIFSVRRQRRRPPKILGDNITQWSRRASRPVQIGTTSPGSERPSPRPWYRRRRNTPSSSLTTFDPKSLVVKRLMAFGELAAPGRHPCISFGRPKRLSTGSPACLKG